MHLYPNLYALLESNAKARALFDGAPPALRCRLLVRQQSIRSLDALQSALAALRV